MRIQWENRGVRKSVLQGEGEERREGDKMEIKWIETGKRDSGVQNFWGNPLIQQ